MSDSSEIQKLIEAGEFSKAQVMLREEAGKYINEETKRSYLDQVDILDRIRHDFRKTEVDIIKELQKDIPDVTKADIEKWLREGVLEGKKIDGEVRFFNRAVINLFRMSKEARQRRDALKNKLSGQLPSPQPLEDSSETTKTFNYDSYIRKILDAGKKSEIPFVLPQKVRFEYSITLNSGVVPEGEIVRCWLPFPRNNKFNTEINLISMEPTVYTIAPEEALQRTVYFEKKISPEEKDGKITFKSAIEFTTYAFVRQIDPQKILPYNTDSLEYKEYAKEKPPHLVFTEDLKKTARMIVGDEKNPYLKAKKIFEWISNNILYTSALEYSTIPNISEYCLKNRRGDCGIQAMLFIVLCRIEGIPARWQAGWSLLPGGENMHDWAQFYVEPYGWLPVDPSRGLRKSDDPEVRWFFFGNLDAFRLMCNDDFSTTLVPPKKFLRSEPVDFQRGEIEWKEGNIYFDKWSYNFKITILNPLP